MQRKRALLVLLALAVAAAAAMQAFFPRHDAAQDWEQRKQHFRQAALSAGPLILAIDSYTAVTGNPPQAIDDLVPGYLEQIPATGLQECASFEYRSLAHRLGSIVWYDLGSREGQPYKGPSRFAEGDPGHAIMVFTLDAQGKISSALIDRLPQHRKPQEFATQHWKAGVNRIEMALDLADTYRLDGMPRDVFESLLGPPDGSRAVHGAAWELRINCPTGLFNHDTFVYWPTQEYPRQLYGGTTESVGNWVYIHT